MQPTVQYDVMLLPVLLGGACLLVTAALLVAAVVIWLRRRPKGDDHAKGEFDLTIPVGSLPSHGPEQVGPCLEFMHVPVRMAVLVLAPLGKKGAPPLATSAEQLCEAIVPGLGAVYRSHQPHVFMWPAQLSTEGFIHGFFRHAPLPGQQGRGTPWCAVAGRFADGEHFYLAAILCCAASPNSLGRMEARDVGPWLDVLRVRPPATG